MTEVANMNTNEENESTTPRKRGDGINIPLTQIMAGISGYDAKAQEDLLWLHGYCMARLNGSRSALVDFIGSDWTTIIRIWTGKYGADIGIFVERVRHFRRKAERTEKTGFVKTCVTERIFKVCDVARDYGVFVMIIGGSGRSKTHSTKEWMRLQFGKVHYLYAPVAGGYSGFLKALARSLGIGADRNITALELAIENCMNHQHTLIVDEVAHLLPSGKTASTASLDFLRLLNEKKQCGIVLVTTDVFPQQMRSGKWSQWFEQLDGRIEIPLRIPQDFSRREIADICNAYTADPEPELIKLAREIANKRRGGVRELFRHLNRASDMAGKRGEPLTAKHLAVAYEYAANLLTIPEE